MYLTLVAVHQREQTLIYIKAKILSVKNIKNMTRQQITEPKYSNKTILLSSIK